MPHLVDREDRLQWTESCFRKCRARQSADAFPDDVVPGQHGKHAAGSARGRSVDPLDARMGVRRAQYLREGRARRQQVVDEAPAASEKAFVFQTAHGCADAAHSTFTPVRSTITFHAAASLLKRSATSAGAPPPAIQPCST